MTRDRGARPTRQPRESGDAERGAGISTFDKHYLHDWLTPLAILAILALLDRMDYLAFHLTAELVSAVIGALAFVIAINTWRFAQNSFFYVFGAGSFSVAVIDLIHAMTYKGMNIIPHAIADTNLPTQFWLDGRYLEAATLLLSALALQRQGKWPPLSVIFGFALTTVLLTWGTFEHWFPAAWLPREGLTPFKIGSEYAVIAAYVAAMLLLFRNRRQLAPDAYHLINVAIVLMVMTELCFTLYINVYGFFNVFGHYAKVLSFWLIYLAIVRSTLRQPFAALSASARTFDTIPLPVFVINEWGYIRHANHAAGEAFGMDTAALEQQSVYDLPLAIPTGFVASIRGLVEHGEAFNDTVHTREGGHGYDMRLVPVDWAGSDAAAVLTLTDITPMLQTQTRLEQLAHTDALTGIANRRTFMEQLKEEFERLTRYRNRPSAVLMLDLDLFKGINDTHGHAAGDTMLRHFSDLLKSALRKVDTLARVGGEEFAILLPETDCKGALHFAERLRQIVAASSVAFEGKALGVTTSIGVAALRAEDADPNAALERADAALYRAKREGRNRVILAEDDAGREHASLQSEQPIAT